MHKKQVLQSQGQKILRAFPSKIQQSELQIALSALYQIALKLARTEYFLVTDPHGNWQSVTLENRHAPEQVKTVIYAFGDRTLANIERLQNENSDRLVCQSLSVMDILFQFLGMKQIDSLVLFDHLTAPNQGKEIKRSELENAIRQAGASSAQTQVC